MTRATHRASDVWWTLTAGGVPFLVYLRTMAPTVYALDSAELTTGAYVLGIVHAPGSPTFMLLGHLFTWLPIGDIGYRVNLLSACAAALTISFLYHVGNRLVQDRALALAGSWCLAFSYYFWVSALAAELYAPQACCLAALLLFMLRWRSSGAARFLYAFTFVFGLALGIHISLILTVPGFTWLLLRGPLRAHAQGRVLGGAVLCGLLGASVYGYLPWRYASGTPLDYARDYWQVDLTTVRGVLWMVTGRMFATSFFGVHLLELPRELALYAWRMWSNFVGLGALLGIVGLISGLRERPALHIGLAAVFLAHSTFYLLYSVTDKELMFLPAYLVWSLWVMLGAQWTCAAINRVLEDRWSLSSPTLLFFMAASALLLNFHRVDLSGDVSARVRGERIFEHLPSGAVYLGTWADVPILEYLQIVEERRLDVTLRNLVFLRDSAKAVTTKHLAAHARLFTSAPTMVGKDAFRFKYWRACDCYAIRAVAPRARLSAELESAAGQCYSSHP